MVKNKMTQTSTLEVLKSLFSGAIGKEVKVAILRRESLIEITVVPAVQGGEQD